MISVQTFDRGKIKASFACGAFPDTLLVKDSIAYLNKQTNKNCNQAECNGMESEIPVWQAKVLI